MKVLPKHVLDHDTVAKTLLLIVQAHLRDAIARCVAAKESRELVILGRTAEGMLRCSGVFVTQQSGLVLNVLEKFGPDIPRTKTWKVTFRLLDDAFTGHVSNLHTAAARNGWIDFEAE